MNWRLHAGKLLQQGNKLREVAGVLAGDQLRAAESVPITIWSVRAPIADSACVASNSVPGAS